MQNRIGGRWGLLFGLVGVWAVAQEPVPPEYRPTLAVLEVVATDLSSIERAQQLERELLSLLATSEQFAPAVTSPEQIREEQRELDASCAEIDCFELALSRLSVQRVARVTVERHGSGSRVTVLGLDPSLLEPVKIELDVEDQSEELAPLIPQTPAERDLEFLAAVLPRLRDAFQALATPNGKLVVENADPGLAVLIGEKPAGLGRVEVIKPPGDVLVSIGGTVYEPYDRVVNVRPGEVTTVELRLLARPVPPPVVQREKYAGLMSRPGTYLAMSGLTLLGVGAGLGIATLVTTDRLTQSPVPLTRVEAMNLPAQGVFATFLLASGAALTAGGITWIALTPAKQRLVVDEPSMPADLQGWTFTVGGKL
jgi:hypothetical protein